MSSGELRGPIRTQRPARTVDAFELFGDRALVVSVEDLIRMRLRAAEGSAR